MAVVVREFLSKHGKALGLVQAIGGFLCLSFFVGCEPRRDPLEEHLLKQREMAVKQLEQRAKSDLTLDVLCWDISSFADKPATIHAWIKKQKDLDALALSGPDKRKLIVAAGMEETVDTLDRGWPVVSSVSQAESDSQPTESTQGGLVSVMNANGYRFDGVVTDAIAGWDDSQGRRDAPAPLHLQVRYTPLEVVLVYLTNMQSVTNKQYDAISLWIDTQNAPVIVFGEFASDKLTAKSLEQIEPGRLAVSNSIQNWQAKTESISTPLGETPPQPFVLRAKMTLN